MVMRLTGWDIRLTKYLDGFRKRPIVYSQTDCIMFAAGAVEAQTGEDFAAEHRGRYGDLESARAYMASRGWNDVDDVVDSFLTRVSLAQRRRGYILGFIGPLGKSIGVCVGQNAMVLSPEGAVYYPSSRAFAAWRVGDA